MEGRIEIVVFKLGLMVKKFLEWLEQMFQSEPREEAEIYSKVGKKCIDKGQLDKAMDSLKTAINLNPSDIGSYYKLGMVFIQKELWDDAIACYKKIIKLGHGKTKSGDSNGKDIYLNLGLAYTKKNIINEAINSYKKSLKNYPEQPEVYYRVGLLYGRKKMFDRAIDVYERAIELSPQTAKYYYSLGLTYDSKGERTKAIDAFRKAMEIEEIG